MKSFFDYLFVECSPIQIPLDFLPKVSEFLLDKDPYFWISFMLVSIIVFSRLNKEMKEDFQIVGSQGLNISLFVLFLFSLINCIFISLGLKLQPNPYIAYCEGSNAFTPPPSPVQLPEEPVTPPPPPPVPQPVVIPLLSDDARRHILYTRYSLLNLGGDDDLGRMVSIIDNQVVVERSVEAALIEDGFRRDSIMARFRDIRGILHAPRGALLSDRTYHLYVSQIRERGTRQSVPYRRIIRSIQNFSLFLER